MENIVSHENYVYEKILDLNLSEVQYSCMQMNDLILQHFTPSDYDHRSPITTKSFLQYNVFLYPFKQYHELFFAIRDFFYEIRKPKEPHYLQAWLNVYRKGEYVDWHDHWPAGLDVWHGFYCADVESEFSYTTYKLPMLDYTIDIKSVNNKLVLGKSEDDKHKSSEWNNDNPRITIAFDIVPARVLKDIPINHYIPI